MAERQSAPGGRDTNRTLDRAAIDQVLRRYADIATRQAWDEFGEIVLPDAAVGFTFGTGDAPDLEVTGPEGLAQLGRAATRAFSFYLYAPLNSVVWFTDDDPTGAAGRAYALETAVDQSGGWLDVYGRYEDRYALTGDTWMIAGRRYRELRRHLR